MIAPVADQSTAPHRGRPRSTEVDHAIADATLALLAEEGWAGLTMSGVAHRAGVSTATLYRRFSSKDDLVCAAVTTSYDARPNVDHGSLEADLRAKLDELVERVRGDGGRMVQGVIGEAARNPRLAEILRRTVFSTGRGDLRRIIERAVDRGEIPLPEDMSIAVNLVAGPLFHRLLLTGEPVTARVVDRLLPMLLAALGAPPA
jgi:AcrR family transcriptional regulator